MGGYEGPYVISGRETELESSASLRLAELERGSMVSRMSMKSSTNIIKHEILLGAEC